MAKILLFLELFANLRIIRINTTMFPLGILTEYGIRDNGYASGNSRFHKKSEKNFGGSKKVYTFAVPFETSRVKMRFQEGFGSLTILREKIKEVKKDRKRSL